MTRGELLFYLSAMGVGAVGFAVACQTLTPYPDEDPNGPYQAGKQIGSTSGGGTVDSGLPDSPILEDGELPEGSEPLCSKCSLVATATQPQSITLDPKNIYWTQGAITAGPPPAPLAGTGSIATVARPGGGVTTTLQAGLTGPLIAKYDSSWLTWSAYVNLNPGESSVSLVNVGSSATPTVPGTSQNSAYGVALDSSSVYWVSNDASGNAEVQSAPLLGGGPITLGATSTGPLSPFGMTVSSSTIYFVAYSGGGGGGLYALPLKGGTPNEIWTASSSGKPIDVALDESGANLYWTDDGAGAVYSMPAGGGTVTTIASGIGGPQQLAIDMNNVYFTAFNAGSVYEVPLGSTTATAIVTGVLGTAGIAADDNDSNVYFTSGGAILSHPK